MKKEGLKSYVPIAVIIILIILSFFIIKDFIIALITAMILAFLIRPVYKTLEKKMPKALAAVICIIIIISIIVIPIALIIIAIINELFNYISSDLLVNVIRQISEIKILSWAGLDLVGIKNKLAEIILVFLGNLTARIPKILLDLGILIIAMFYFLIEWDRIIRSMKKYIPSKNKEIVSKDIAKITKAVVYGSLLVALVQFIISIIGFWLLGIKYSLILAAMISILSFLPAIGPGLVWIPTAIILVIQGKIMTAVGMVVLGLILSIYADTIFRAKISGKGTKIHPITMLIGIIGGLALFGIAGFVIGPLILSYTITLIEDITE